MVALTSTAQTHDSASAPQVEYMKSLRTGLRVLVEFERAPRDLGVTDLANRCGLSKSQVFKILSALVDRPAWWCRTVQRAPTTASGSAASCWARAFHLRCAVPGGHAGDARGAQPHRSQHPAVDSARHGVSLPVRAGGATFHRHGLALERLRAHVRLLGRASDGLHGARRTRTSAGHAHSCAGRKRSATAHRWKPLSRRHAPKATSCSATKPAWDWA